MRQVARRLKDGRLELVEVPDPAPGPGMVSVRLEASVLSAGTERAALEIGRKSLVGKARARPDQARQVLNRMRTEGVRSTMELVRNRLEELGPIGYSAAGTVIEAGPATRELAPGDRVAIAGGGFAGHAEVDVVPSLLCARVPDGVDAEEAAFATLGAIAINGFRRGETELGSTVAVVGLGLIGQLAARVARAAGCRVLGVDLQPELLELARRAGAEVTPRSELDEGSRWEGAADAVLVCAATASNDPILLAARLARDRAPVVVVGDVAMDLPRAPFYEKELDLRLARSYGPGRYDPNYELHGLDYPIGYVRWTEQRNMAAFLGLIADQKIRPAELITHRFALGEAKRAFEVLEGEETTVGIVLGYAAPDDGGTVPARPSPAGRRAQPAAREGRRLGVIGAGSFATATLIPGLVRAGFEPVAVASAAGLSAEGARRRFDFETAHARVEEILERDDLDLVAIATRHDSHAELAARALEAGRMVYVEKPLALDWDQLRLVMDAQLRAGSPLLVGFNRRYAPLAGELRNLSGPRLMAYRVNAGRLDRDHWLNDLAQGGGRLKGEGCHFIDFLCDQAGADPQSVVANGFPSDPELSLGASDNFSVQITFADGGVGTVNYAADAPSGPGKERFETSAPGAYAVIEDFKSGSVWKGGRRRSLGGRRQDKGFSAHFELLRDVARGEAEAPGPESFYLSTLATLAAARSLQTGRPETVTEPAAVADQ
ncbi:MAG TPA: bi-domain-containing oxidoreductase [Solirubrobacterales bacterium]|nr:bi-domain-containing oxidoreductase [Solirubrobacterales bacterium]